MTAAENETYFRTRYAEARAVFPLLPLGVLFADLAGAVTITTEELNAGGLPVFCIPPGFDVAANDALWHVCKHETGHAYLRVLERVTGVPRAVYLSRFGVQFGYGAGVDEESWAETFCNACEGRVVTSKTYHDETVDPLAARAFFLSLHNPSAVGTDVQPTVVVSTPIVVGGPKVLASLPPLDPPDVVVDYFSPKGAEFMACLRENGVRGIARYLTNDPRDIRQITRAEVAAAHAAGLAVHFFYEVNPPNPPASLFTYAKGGEDCRQAIDRLRELGAPEGTVVYFCIDNDIEPSAADGYFNAVEWNVTPQIVPGIYGFERMVQYARQYYPNVGQHLAQTYGTKRGPLDLWQNRQDALCGVSVDFNECAADGWRAPKEVEVTDEEFIEKTRRLITPTLDAMKTAYDPLIVAARANGLIDATQEAHLAALDTRLAKLRDV